MRSERIRTVLCVLLIFVAALIQFSVSVKQRAQWFGEAQISMAGWFTAGTCVCARNWYLEGPWTLRFGMYWAPDSIETDLESREPYVSFPPGSILPVYLLAKIRGHEPTIPMVMRYNLFNQCCVAVVLGLLAFAVARRMNFSRGVACIFAMIPPTLYIWFPVAFYEHEMGYFSDQAIILPFALYAFLEVLRTANVSSKRARRLGWIQGVIAFFGVLTDWLFIPVLFCAWLLRLFRAEFGRKFWPILARSVLFAMPVLLALTLFTIQLHHLNGFNKISERFWMRTGLKEQKFQTKTGRSETYPMWKNLVAFPLDSQFWKRHIKSGFGKLGKPVILCCAGMVLAMALLLAAFRFRGKSAPPELLLAAEISFFMLAPCLLYLHMFKEHSSFWLHSFTTLKFALPLAIIPLVTVPALVLRLFQRPWLHWMGAAAVLLLACGWAWSLDELRMRSFPDRQKDHIPIGNFIASHTAYEDVVFSPDYSIADRPPQSVAYAKKLVYKITDIQDIRNMVGHIPGEYRVCLFFQNIEKQKPLPWLEPLKRAAYEVFSEGDMRLYKIRKAEYLAL
ncbi:MAG TPA: hypothetical protein PLI09_15545 [Candidatus Hydrogenedentes bacterium]|nr:hypothetical protein [Candidatus Hydrogenedentota bacterium]